MIISGKKNCVFIHNPKVAGCSIRKSLESFDDFDGFFWDRGYIKGIDHPVDKPHITMNDLAKTDYFKYLLDKDKFVFGFVRNPYERVCSAYFEVRKQLRNISEDFNGFIIELDETKIRYDYKYIHFCPQHYFFYDGQKCYVDFIGRYERLDRDMLYINSVLGLSNKLEKINESTEKKEDYLSYYNEEAIRTVNRIYEKDFLLFGYEMIGDYLVQDHDLSNPEWFAEFNKQKPISQLIERLSLNESVASQQLETIERLNSVINTLKEQNQTTQLKYKQELLEEKSKAESKEDELRHIYSSRAWRFISFFRKLYIR